MGNTTFSIGEELESKTTEPGGAEGLPDRNKAFVQLLQKIIVASNEATTVEEALQFALDKVCVHTGWPIGHVYITNSEGELSPTTIWHLENPERFKTFREVTEASRFTSGVGLPGRVLANGKPAWIVDVTSDPNFPRAKQATDIGVRAGFAFPVLIGTEVVAVLEFFSENAVEPNEALLEVMAHIGTQLGRVIERRRAEDALQDNLAQLAKKNRYETIISTITRAVHQSINLQDVLENAAEAMNKNIDKADNVSIYLIEGKEIVLKAYRGYPDLYIERVRRILYPVGFTWKAIIDGKLRYCPDTDQDTAIGPAGREIGTKSYLSMPVRSEGQIIGAININSLHKNAFDAEELNLLEIVAQQIEIAVNNARQAEALRQSELLQHLAAGTASATGADFFRSLVQNVASALQVRYAFVTQCTDATLTRVRTLAFWGGKDFGDNFEYDLSGTPCENVIAGNVCYYPKDLQPLFPRDVGLAEWGAESFLGIPIRDSWENTLGHLAALDDKPMADKPRGMTILQIFAARAGAELERKRAEDALRESYTQLAKKNRYETIVGTVTRAVHQSINLQDVFENAVESMSRNIDRADSVGIYLIEGQEAVMKAYRGYSNQYIERIRSIPQPKDFTWKVITEGKPRYCPDTDRDTFIDRVGRETGIGSYLSMPIHSEGKTSGTINILSFQKNAFSEEEIKLLEMVARQIEVAINNAQQAEALRKSQESLQKALRELEQFKNRLQIENVYLQEEIKTEYNFEEIIGQSESLKKSLRKAEQVASADATVLIQGETGTGKELLARAIHNLSSRKDRPLVKVNCGAISPGLVESELFGHEKGAFTGALQRRVGRFELADGGTIFLDEVGELPPDTQVKLLRVLQEGEFERVGSSKPVKVDVRVIAATNRDLTEAVKAGTFRSDLFYRLNVFPIEMPPLRERKSDIPLLATFFLTKFSKKLNKPIQGISRETMDRLMGYNWPGNIRELQNVIERAVVISQGPEIQIDESIFGLGIGTQTLGGETLEDIERSHILRVLEQTDWVVQGKGGAASILGINPNTLRSRMQKLGIKKPPDNF
ncbi:MAG TPA: sigma 54-interacting transcriptional regulator [Thermodesulfobacteriota bacterium]|nr:sigma 54-interacting transcriptional regulator [Thermodesulfobacteriota bacterium]